MYFGCSVEKKQLEISVHSLNVHLIRMANENSLWEFRRGKRAKMHAFNGERVIIINGTLKLQRKWKNAE